MVSTRATLKFEVITPLGRLAIERDASPSAAEFAPRWIPAGEPVATFDGEVDDTAELPRCFATSGRDTVTITPIRRSAPAHQVTASAVVRERRLWFNVDAPTTDLAPPGREAETIESLWLGGIIAFRQLVLERGENMVLWLMGRTRSDLVCLTSDGRATVSEHPQGSEHLVELVQSHLGLHFRASAHDLVFGDEHAWEETGAALAAAFAGPVATQVRPAGTDATLVVLGLGIGQGELEGAFARELGLKPWTGPSADELSRRGWSYGSAHTHHHNPSAAAWLLACVAAPDASVWSQRLAFGGPPLAVVDAPPTAPATADAGPDRREPSAGPILTTTVIGVAAATNSPDAAPHLPAPGGETGAAGTPAAVAAAASGRRKTRRRRLSPQAREELRQDLRDTVRKWLFVILYTAAVAVAGYFLMGKPADPAPIVR